ncbi:hypothetical protein ACWIUD_02300 [Helicobacter sp. 23-1044]
MNQMRIADFKVNLWVDSKNNLLIRFWVIDFFYLLDSRVLDCHENATHFLAMTAW